VGTLKKIPIGDFPLGPEEKKALQRVIDSGRITEGFEVRAFEDEFAAYMGTRHCVATSSGTAALAVGLRALSDSKQVPIWEGARVLVPALTFIATANAVAHAGMRVMFGDIDPNTMCLSPAAIAETRTEIVMPVHLMGFAADMKPIIEACTRNQQMLVEDAAEAHGTTYEGKKVGTFGVFGAFSFYIAHTVQAGELAHGAGGGTRLHRHEQHGRGAGRPAASGTRTGMPLPDLHTVDDRLPTACTRRARSPLPSAVRGLEL